MLEDFSMRIDPHILMRLRTLVEEIFWQIDGRGRKLNSQSTI